MIIIKKKNKLKAIQKKKNYNKNDNNKNYENYI